MKLSLTDLIACYAALVATVVLVWDIAKWRLTGPQVVFEAQTGMVLTGGIAGGWDRIISFQATNNGDRATTITNVGFEAYSSGWARLRGKHCFAAVVMQPGVNNAYTVPFELRPGAVWQGRCEEDPQILELIAKRRCYAVLSESHKGKHHRVLLTSPKRPHGEP